MDISIKKGSRVFICGMSGCGKTTLALSLCEVMPSPLVILDTKYDPSLGEWAKKNKVHVTYKMPDWRNIKGDVVIRPPADWLAAPKDLDWWLEKYTQCPYVPSIYIDEGLQVGAGVHSVGRGVTGLWSRGRAFGVRALFGTQRPAWISKYVLTESDVMIIGLLKDKKDRQAIYDATSEDASLKPQQRHHFLYIQQSGLGATPLAPLDVTKKSQYLLQSRDSSRIRLKPLREPGLVSKIFKR